MKRIALSLFSLALVAGCVSDGVPSNSMDESHLGVMEIAPFTIESIPKLGTLTLVGDGDTLTLQTVDFSIGAVDPSAWFQKIDDQPTLALTAYANEDTNLDGYGAVRIRAIFDTVGVGKATWGSMTLFTNTFERASSAPEFSITSVEVTAISPAPPNSLESYRRIQGVIKGRGCEINKPCFEVNGTFDTIGSVEE